MQKIKEKDLVQTACTRLGYDAKELFRQAKCAESQRHIHQLSNADFEQIGDDLKKYFKTKKLSLDERCIPDYVTVFAAAKVAELKLPKPRTKTDTRDYRHTPAHCVSR